LRKLQKKLVHTIRKQKTSMSECTKDVRISCPLLDEVLISECLACAKVDVAPSCARGIATRKEFIGKVVPGKPPKFLVKSYTRAYALHSLSPESRKAIHRVENPVIEPQEQIRGFEYGREKNCASTGCTRKARHGNLCRLHYEAKELMNKPVREKRMPKPSKCTFPGCTNTKVVGRGLCGKHYYHARKEQGGIVPKNIVKGNLSMPVFFILPPGVNLQVLNTAKEVKRYLEKNTEFKGTIIRGKELGLMKEVKVRWTLAPIRKDTK